MAVCSQIALRSLKGAPGPRGIVCAPTGATESRKTSISRWLALQEWTAPRPRLVPLDNYVTVSVPYSTGELLSLGGTLQNLVACQVFVAVPGQQNAGHDIQRTKKETPTDNIRLLFSHLSIVRACCCSE